MNRKIATLLALAFILLVMVGCADEDDIKDIVQYDLLIHNNTGTAYDVWMSNPLENNEFYESGHVAANESFTVNDLSIGVVYTVHLTTEGGPADIPVHARLVNSADEDVTWTIDP